MFKDHSQIIHRCVIGDVNQKRICHVVPVKPSCYASENVCGLANCIVGLHFQIYQNTITSSWNLANFPKTFFSKVYHATGASKLPERSLFCNLESKSVKVRTKFIFGRIVLACEK